LQPAFAVAAGQAQGRNEQRPRPLTHDAWADTSRALGGQVQDVLIYDLKDYTYYVWVRIQHNGGIVQVDLRPSDAVILAGLGGKT